MESFLDTLPLWAALLPLGIYLVALGAVHLRRRPLVISGTCDAVLLGGSLTGLAMAGPLALVRPAVGNSLWGWLMVLLLFGLIVALCVLVSRPRLVAYNMTVDQFRPLVAEVVTALDGGARWAGESAALPNRSLQIHIDGNGALRSVSVVAVGERVPHEAWAEFARRVGQAAGRLRVKSSPWGPVFAGIGCLLIAVAAWSAWRTAVDRVGDPEGANDAGARRFVGT